MDWVGAQAAPLVGRRMVDLMPRLANIRVRRTWRGLYPMTPDGSPIIGRARELEGYIHAVGMCGQGFMIGPGLGEMLAKLVTGSLPEADAEVLKMPNRFPDSADTSYNRLPIQHGDFEPTTVFERIRKGDWEWISEEFMLNGYIESLERYPHVWRRLFSDLAEPQNRPLLFHCTGGKDRTGTGAALILLALGVPEASAVRDFGLSDGYNAETRKTIYAHLRPLGVDIARVEPYFVAPESRIRALLDYIRDHFGTAVGYLVKKAGVSEETIERLRDDLLE